MLAGGGGGGEICTMSDKKKSLPKKKPIVLLTTVWNERMKAYQHSLTMGSGLLLCTWISDFETETEDELIYQMRK